MAGDERRDASLEGGDEGDGSNEAEGRPDEPRGPSAILQRADCAAHVVVLEVRVPGRTSHVLVAAGDDGGCAALLSRDTMKRAWAGRLPPGAARERARESTLEGARVLGLSPPDAPREVRIDQRGMPRVLRVVRGRVVVTDADAGEPPDAIALVDLDDDRRARLEERGDALVVALGAMAIEASRADATRALARAQARIARRREAIQGDLARIGDADRLAAQAQWLVPAARRAPRGATQLEVTDWSTGEAVPLIVPLDPSKAATEQVEAMFKRAKRLRLGARFAEERLAQTDVQARAIDDALAKIHDAREIGAIDDAARAAKRAAPRDVALPGSATRGGGDAARGEARAGRGDAAGQPQGRRVPYRAYLARSGRRLLVGKGAADNDALTLHVAKPHDLWLHAKDRTGSHVIVPLEKGRTCPGDDLVDAAHLAAHYSDARGDAIVDVQHTPRRYLRKPKGSAPGFVVVTKEKVLPLRVDAALVRALLDREEA